MRTCKLSLTVEQLRAIECGLRLQPHDGKAQELLSRIETAIEVLSSTSGSDGNGNGNGNGNGGDDDELLARPTTLSRKEMLVLKYLSQGMSNKLIARQIVCTESTVKVHMKAVLRKLRFNNRTQAAVWARSNLGLADAAI